MKKLLSMIGLLAIAAPISLSAVACESTDKPNENYDLGTIVFLDSNHDVKDNKNVSETEVISAVEKIKNRIILEIAFRIPGAELEKDYIIDSSEIKPGDLSRGVEVFINAKQESTLIKEETFTSVWVLFVNADTPLLRGTNLNYWH